MLDMADEVGAMSEGAEETFLRLLVREGKIQGFRI